MEYTEDELKYYKGMLEYGLLIRQDEINRYNKQIYECMRNGQFLMIPYIKRKIYNCERVIDEIKDALLNYEKTRDFTLLKKRIIFLTHNYIMNKKLTKGQIKAGIYFSYPYANPEENGSLYNLDKFLQICVLIVMYKDGRRKPKYAFSVFAAKVL